MRVEELNIGYIDGMLCAQFPSPKPLRRCLTAPHLGDGALSQLSELARILIIA